MKDGQEPLSYNLQKALIKTEMEDDLSISEDIFVDCTTLLSCNYLKLETQEQNAGKRRPSKRRNKSEANDEEHQKLLAEFRTVLKKRKDKR